MSQKYLPGVVALGDVNMYTAITVLMLDQIAMNPDAPEAPGLNENARDVLRKADQSFSAYLAVPRSAEEDVLASRIQTARANMNAAIASLRAAIGDHDKQKINDISANVVPDAFVRLDQSVGKLKALILRRANDSAAASAVTSDDMFVLTVGAIILGLGGAVASWVSLRRAIMVPLQRAQDQFDRISVGT